MDTGDRHRDSRPARRRQHSPEGQNYGPVVAVASVLSVLLVIAQMVSKPPGFAIGWALWLVLVFTLIQAVAASKGSAAWRPVSSRHLRRGFAINTPISTCNTPSTAATTGNPLRARLYRRSVPAISRRMAVAIHRPAASVRPVHKTGRPTTGFPSFSPPPSAGQRQESASGRPNVLRSHHRTTVGLEAVLTGPLARLRYCPTLVIGGADAAPRVPIRHVIWFRVAFGPSVVALVVITAVTLLQLLIANSDMTGALGAVASIWLAVHQVPISIAGHQLAALPLLPVLLMVWGTARATGAGHVGAGVVVRYPVGGGLGGRRSDVDGSDRLAVIHDASSVITELDPGTSCAPSGVLAVHGIGALIGVGSRSWRRVAKGASNCPAGRLDALRRGWPV